MKQAIAILDREHPRDGERARKWLKNELRILKSICDPCEGNCALCDIHSEIEEIEEVLKA